MLSRNNFLLEKSITNSQYMRKLNQRKIRWIIREMEKGERSVYRIAKLQDISSRWVRNLYRSYSETGEYPYPNKPGRRPRPISKEERQIVLDVRKEHPLCAVILEKILAYQGINISHNRIHKILKEEGLSMNHPKKQKQRKYVRYERKHSNSLWHTDWFEHKEDKMINFEDDASRFITGFGVFTNATSQNSASIFEQAVEGYICPKQIMTDHGTQFISLPRSTCSDPEPNVFQKKLEQYQVKHIKARVKHPQSNGKMERAGGTLKRLYQHFNDWSRTVLYYNFERPHMSLQIEQCETPFQAYVRKLHYKSRMHFIKTHQELVKTWAPEYIDRM